MTAKKVHNNLLAFFSEANQLDTEELQQLINLLNEDFMAENNELALLAIDAIKDLVHFNRKLK